MTGWNRLFVVITVCWALVAPFLLMAETNGPLDRVTTLCSDTALFLYGSSSSPHSDMDKYRAEVAECIERYMQHLVTIPKVLSAMVGGGERELGLVAWALILIPPALLWVVCWGVGRVVGWVAAGFRRP